MASAGPGSESGFWPPALGDGVAFGRLIAPHRRGHHLHCYRLLGEVHDADDALQETLLRAWRAIDRF
ncbi:MAG: hypothetical protein JO304_26505 [Solirubrobacterales bacterium]|nr:hypothetical protein [Solirubrobacterales bacterium]